MSELNEKLLEIKRQKDTYIIPENIKKDITVYGVTGTLEPGSSGSGDVKLFETVEEMQADSNPSEGDLAVVYRNDIMIPSPGDTINSFGLLNTMVFDTPITSSVSLVLSSETLYIICILNATSFTMRDMRGSVIQNTITYTSSDGITYVRTDSGETSYDLGEDVTIPSTADTNILKFLSTEGMVFEGLYEYKTNQYIIADTQLTATPENVYTKTFYGKNGVEIGNIQNNKNLDITTLRDRIITIYDSIIKSTLANDITDLSSMFERCSDIITVPLFDTSNVTNMYRMFNLCQNLIEIPLFDTSNVTNMNGMLANCDKLTIIPQLDTSKVTDMKCMFQSCDKLITIPLINTSKVTSMNQMFDGCKSLTSIPLLDTSSVIEMVYMFEYCTSLTTVPQLDTSKVTNMFDVFNGCTSLSNESLNNILAMCIGATSYNGTKTLKYVMGLTSAQATTCQSLSNYQAFLDAGWTTGY